MLFPGRFWLILFIFHINSFPATGDERSLSEMLIDMINLFSGKPTMPAEISSARPLPSAAQCAQRCTAHMRECAHNEIPGFEKQIWLFEYEPNKLETYCQIHENGSECLNTCPESIAKSLADNGLTIGRKICNGSAIRRHARCITEAVEPLQSLCHTASQCGKFPFPERQDIRPSSADEFQRLMRQTCLRLKCNLECAASTITERCGQSAEQDVELVVQTAARYLKTLTGAIKVPHAYATECDLLETPPNSTVITE